ncbi:MFS transporter [Antrihabitans spumae]|uniref:MFS transporter n=1 Tax=Antrihabitans spumae TaxID=3373370 RepID=A0ABW7KSA5_9NOCA
MYALYALLFADHGLDTAEISSLLFIWSVTAFVFEVPSGAWADTVSRRGLLVLGALVTASGFAVWTVFPSYAGFALGFVLWGIGGSLQSGTFQALLYDELAARSATREYARIIGFANSAAETGALLGILSAAPLFAWGGYGLVGASSVAVALCAALLAASLPSAPKAASVAAVAEIDDDGDDYEDDPDVAADTPTSTYLTMLRSGVTEALRHKTVRRGVLLSSVLFGFTAIDEYFGLLAEDNGAATGFIPILVGLTVAGSLVGSALAGRTASMKASTMARGVVVAGIALAGGALIGGPGILGIIGFAAIGVGYGIITNAVIVSEARLQDAIEGPARATVTSASSLLAEVVSLAIFAAVALGSVWLSTPVLVALLGIPVVLAAALVPKWLPRQSHGPTVTG